MRRNIHYSIESLLRITTSCAVGWAALVWIAGAPRIHLPDLVPAWGGFVTIGGFIAPIMFAICSTYCFASGLNRDGVLHAAVLYTAIACLSVLDFAGMSIVGQATGPANLLRLERYVAVMFGLIVVGILETTLRRLWAQHLSTVVAMSMASCCMYLFWWAVVRI